MRRVLFVAGAVAALALVALLLLNVSLPAQPARPAQSGNSGDTPLLKPPQPKLPIAQVVLFSSGVGYYQREGEVEGDARIDLSFPVENINDLLKSMVLQDLGGGHVSAVSYDSHDPIERTLRSFAVNLTTNPSFGDLLNQARGEKVEVTMQTSTTQPGTLTGVVVGMEKQKQPAGKDGVVEMEMLNLLSAEGMRCLKLAEVQRVRFLNPVIDSELRRALEVLALSHDTQKKAVSLSFAGEGKRPVRVGYVTESPIWKTSYRLVLGKDGKPFLQGWAVVENPSDEDWTNVRMALVSGRPISFQMNLYQPLYVPRPMVVPELFASLRPQAYGGSMDRPTSLAGATPPAPAASLGAAVLSDGAAAELRTHALLLRNANGQLGDQARKALELGYARQLGGQLAEKMDLGRGVTSAATATDMGEFFQYLIGRPVTLLRQKSAMLPIVNQDVEGTKVSIYNQSVHAKFPLHGLKFKNTSGLHLMQGPITVFEGSSYAGDARIMDLQPGEERLISYAIDLGTEVEPVAKNDPDRITAIRIVKGLVHATHKLRESRTFNVKNRSDQDRTIIIEHPFRPDFKLIEPEKASERTREVYRFELKAPKGQAIKQEVVEERDLVQTVAISNSDDQSIRFFLNSTVSSPRVKDAFRKALEMKTQLATTQRDLNDLNQQLKAITDDQTRLRANLKEMPPTAAAYKRYLEKFDKQETEIEQLQDKIKKSQQTVLEQRKEYDGYLASLTVE